jgi:hypothetical protein
MPVVEIWYRRKRGDAYRRQHGTEEVEALLKAGSRMTIKVDGKDCRVTVDKAAPAAIGAAAVGMLWVTEA